jgi:uncharacterized protein YkwD
MSPLLAMLLTLNLDSPAFPPLPAAPPPTSGQATIPSFTPSAHKLFDDLNAARRTAGLAELKFDAKLTRIANSYALEMLRHDYVGHVSPDGTTLAERLDRAAYPFEWAGENIAYAADESDAHNGLWNSPDHRENMLETNFGKVGIAAVPAWHGWTIFVEEFSN